MQRRHTNLVNLSTESNQGQFEFREIHNLFDRFAGSASEKKRVDSCVTVIQKVSKKH